MPPIASVGGDGGEAPSSATADRRSACTAAVRRRVMRRGAGSGRRRRRRLFNDKTYRLRRALGAALARGGCMRFRWTADEAGPSGSGDVVRGGGAGSGVTEAQACSAQPGRGTAPPPTAPAPRALKRTTALIGGGRARRRRRVVKLAEWFDWDGPATRGVTATFRLGARRRRGWAERAADALTWAFSTRTRASRRPTTWWRSTRRHVPARRRRRDARRRRAHFLGGVAQAAEAHGKARGSSRPGAGGVELKRPTAATGGVHCACAEAGRSAAAARWWRGRRVEARDGQAGWADVVQRWVSNSARRLRRRASAGDW